MVYCEFRFNDLDFPMSVLSISLDSLATIGIPVAAPGRGAATGDAVGAAQDHTGSDGKSAQETQYTPSQQRRIAELARIDAEVRAHEQAHINVGRDLITSGPSYEYTYGPDGRRYAVGGEVGIDTSAEKEAQANIDKGQRIQDTALAPADPSPQDYAVATTGRALEELGRNEIRQQQLAEAESPRRSPAQAYDDAEPAGPRVDVYA
jgi:hypothetical protein